MDWTTVVYGVGVGVGMLLIAVALVVFVVVAIPVLRETRHLAADVRRLVALTESELRPTLAELRQTTAALADVSAELRPRLERVDRLADHAEETLATVRKAGDAVVRWADLPAAGVASVAAGLKRASGFFGRGRSGGGPVESGDETEDTR